MNTKETKAIRKQALEEYLTWRVHAGEAFVRYMRAEDGKPYACLVVLRDFVRQDVSASIFLVGWSLCSQKDQFDRKKALKIAVSRALSGQILYSDKGTLIFAKLRQPGVSTEDLVDTARAAKQYFEERDKKK